jgi:hypothetical protein
MINDASNVPCIISVVEGKGRVLIATRNILAGEKIFSEDPILTSHEVFISAPLKKTLEKLNFGLRNFYSFKNFQKLSPELKIRFLNLFGPTEKIEIDENYRLTEKAVKKACCLTKAETTTFLKVAAIFGYNAFEGKMHGLFDHEKDKEKLVTEVYETITMISHSCKGNTLTTDGVLRALSDIAEGEELTLSYNGPRDTEQTWHRRAMYVMTKDFLCECPRCSALGDDTRQFNCENKTCSGRHYACQRNLADTPYLLPCNVCNQPPSKAYEQLMFETEKDLQTHGKELLSFVKESLTSNNCRLKDPTKADSLLAQSLARPPTDYHLMAAPMLLGRAFLVMYSGHQGLRSQAIPYIMAYARLFDSLSTSIVFWRMASTTWATRSA